MEPRLIIAGLAIALPLGAGVRAAAAAAWRTSTVQDLVLRWTGESLYVPTSYLHKRPIVHGTPREPLVGRRHRLPGRKTTGVPVRASAPAARNTSPRAAGLTVRPGGAPALMAHPSAGADTHRAATAGEDPDRPAVAADHQAGAP